MKSACSLADPSDSRGPGWYCCLCNTYNDQSLLTCRYCSHPRCGEATLLPDKEENP